MQLSLPYQNKVFRNLFLFRPNWSSGVVPARTVTQDRRWRLPLQFPAKPRTGSNSWPKEPKVEIVKKEASKQPICLTNFILYLGQILSLYKAKYLGQILPQFFLLHRGTIFGSNKISNYEIILTRKYHQPCLCSTTIANCLLWFPRLRLAVQCHADPPLQEIYKGVFGEVGHPGGGQTRAEILPNVPGDGDFFYHLGRS